MKGRRELVGIIRADDAAAGGERQGFENARKADLADGLAGVLVNREAGEGGNRQAGRLEPLPGLELVAGGLGRVRRVVGEPQSLAGQRRGKGRAVPHCDDRLDRGGPGVLQDQPRAPLRVLEAQRERPVLPRVLHHMAAVRPEDTGNVESPGGRHEVVGLVAGRAEEQQEPPGGSGAGVRL